MNFRRLLLLTCLVFSAQILPAQWTVSTFPTGCGQLYEIDFLDWNPDFGVAVGLDGYTGITTDKGNTWIQNQIPGASHLYAAGIPTNGSVSVGGEGGIWMTTNNGATWTQTLSLTNPGFDAVFSIDFMDPNFGTMVGRGGITASTSNGGATWTMGNSMIANDINMVRYPGQGFFPGIAYSVSSGGHLLITNDHGNTWVANLCLANSDIQSLHFLDSDSGYVGLKNGGWKFTWDGGISWYGSTIPGAGDITDLYFFNSQNGIAISPVGGMFRTLDGGGSWIQEALPPGPTGSDTLMAIDVVGDTCAWIAGGCFTTWRSCDLSLCTPMPRAQRTAVCKGDTTLLLAANGWTSYQWTDANTNTVVSTTYFYEPTIDTTRTFYFEASRPQCGTYYDTLTVGVLYCDSVWPGDADANGVANIYDLLQIGIGFGDTGPLRPGANNSWTAQFATDWATATGALNHKHADCDGNGLVNYQDTVALFLNYGNTHTRLSQVASLTGAPIYLDALFDSLVVGDTGQVDVYLGTPADPLQNIYGAAFTFTYDKALIDSASITMDFSDCWIGTPGTDLMHMYRDIFTTGGTDGGVVRIDQTERSGYGKLARITFVTVDNISGKRALLTETLRMGLAGSVVVRLDGSQVEVAESGDSLVVWDTENSIAPLAQTSLRIYPQPASELLRIDLEGSLAHTLRLYDLQGRQLLEQAFTDELSVAHLPEGVYLLHLETTSGMLVRKIQVHR